MSGTNTTSSPYWNIRPFLPLYFRREVVTWTDLISVGDFSRSERRGLASSYSVVASSLSTGVTGGGSVSLGGSDARRGGGACSCLERLGGAGLRASSSIEVSDSASGEDVLEVQCLG